MLWKPRQVRYRFQFTYISGLIVKFGETLFLFVFCCIIYTVYNFNPFLFNPNIVDSLLNYETVKLYAAEPFEGKYFCNELKSICAVSYMSFFIYYTIFFFS